MRFSRATLKRLFGGAGVTALALAFGCDVQWCEDETYFRYDPGGDALDLLVVYKGVTLARDAPEVRERAVDLCREFLAGRRRFAIFGGSLSFDLDDMVAELSRPDPEPAGGE
ncbi:MAG: hypothetical protein ACUVYA_21380, partial [Planctomycetota bacterium]